MNSSHNTFALSAVPVQIGVLSRNFCPEMRRCQAQVRVLVVLWECCGFFHGKACLLPGCLPSGGLQKSSTLNFSGEPLPETKNGHNTCSEGSDFEEDLCGRRYLSWRIFYSRSQRDPAKPERQKSSKLNSLAFGQKVQP